MLDIHSHILPKMDDGSKSTEMTMQMLHTSKSQGVDTMVSTSHFYGDNEAPESFLKRRAHAFRKIEPLLDDSCPEILLGAEVLFYPGISHSESIASLHIRGTDLLMIELPFVPWTDKIFDELLHLQYNMRLHIVLAHVERYRAIQKRAMFESLLDQPFYFQCNAEAFTSFGSRRLALSMIQRGLLHFLGTDCHNITSRSPNMDEARKIVEKKLSPAAWRDLTRACEDRFNDHRNNTEDNA